MANLTKLFLIGLIFLLSILMPNSVKALTMTATQIRNSAIANADYEVTCDDGTVLGFEYYSTGRACFCGAITTATSITVPDTIICSDAIFVVVGCGASDFEDAPNLISLSLPATISSISDLPSTLTELHLQSMSPPSTYYCDRSKLENLVIYVPESAFTTYYSYVGGVCDSYYSKYSGLNVVYEGWEPQSYNINVPSPGQLANLLLNEIDKWTDVAELTISGRINEDDMSYFSRLSLMRKLDLSQTDITSVGGCGGLFNLSTVVLPSSVTNVKYDAFGRCLRLKSISLPNAKTIGNSAFYNCNSLQEIDLPKATNIGNSAFSSCDSLRKVNIPLTKVIGSLCFNHCTALDDIDLSSVDSIFSSAFYCCESLQKADLSNAKYIDSNSSGTFEGCISLKSVILPDKLTFIAEDLFANCDSLKSIQLPNSIKEIDSGAFSGCSLTSVIIPEGCVYVGSGAFSGCPLQTITIPSTIRTLGYNAFNSTEIKDIYCHAIIPFSYSFSTYATSATLHVPEFSMNAYRLHDDWYDFAQIVPLEDDVKNMVFTQDYSIYDVKGLAENVDLTLDWFSDYRIDDDDVEAAHLTVNSNSPLDLGCYKQYQSIRSGNATTLITHNEIMADKVCTYAHMPSERWNFISFPYDVNVSDIVVPEGMLWVVRKYSGEDRAAMTGNTWQNMVDGTVLKAGEGYIFHCYSDVDDYYYNYYSYRDSFEVQFPAANGAGTLFAYDDVVTPLAEYPSEYAHNRSWNLVGNPYPAYFNTQQIEFDAPITVWNGSGYTAYSLLDDSYVLSPNEAFFVQCPDNSSAMTFHKEGRMHSATIAESEDSTYRTKVRSKSGTRLVYNFMLANDVYTDRARLVINEDAKEEYEANCDASKFMSSNDSVPQLYINERGVKYAIDERPLGAGVITLGAFFGEEGEYTFSLATNPSDESVILTDNVTGVKTDLSVGSYAFESEAGSYASRFTISFGSVTDIDELETDDATESAVYTLEGKRVTNAESLPAGVYVIKKGGKYVKQIIKK